MKKLKFFCMVAALLFAATTSAQVKVSNGVTRFGQADTYTHHSDPTLPGQQPGVIDSVLNASPTTYAKIMDVYGGINQICRSNGDNHAYILSQGENCIPLYRLSASGEVYAYGGYSQASDENLKTNIEQMPAGLLDRLDMVNAYTYCYILKDADGKETVIPEKRVGFLAQELREVFPELVTEIGDGVYGVRYAEMVPVLLASIKELRHEVSDLKEQLGVYAAPAKVVAGSDEMIVDDTRVYIKQNKPNPFSATTNIEYCKGNAENASIHIYDLTGKELKNYKLTERSGVLSIAANEFAPGMYIYGMMLEGEMHSTHRMVISQ